MNPFEYYLLIDESYHGEVYDLIQIISQDIVTPEDEKEIQRAQERLDELIAKTESG